MESYLAKILQVPEFRKILYLYHLTHATRLMNKLGSMAIHDIPFNIVMHPTSFPLTGADIIELAAKFSEAETQHKVFCIKTTPSDIRRDCDVDLMGKLLNAFGPSTCSITHLIAKGITNLGIFLPHLLTHSFRLTHLNISSYHTTAAFWSIIPNTLQSLRCSVDVGPQPHTPRLHNLRAVSDHGMQALGVSILYNILCMAPGLEKLMRKQPQLFSVSNDEAMDDSIVPAIISLEQRITDGLRIDYADQLYKVGLSYSADNNTLIPLLSRISNIHPMMFASDVIIPNLNNCPDRSLLINKIIDAFPNASVRNV